jgi:hypothetical protein
VATTIFNLTAVDRIETKLDALRALVIQQEKSEMKAIDDLQAAEAALATDVMNAVTLIQTLQSGTAVPEAQVEAVVANLTALHTKLSAAAPPPPPPVPPAA